MWRGGFVLFSECVRRDDDILFWRGGQSGKGDQFSQHISLLTTTHQAMLFFNIYKISSFQYTVHKCTAFFHAVYYGHCTVYCILYSVLYSVHCVQCTVHCTVYCTQCTVYCTLCTVLAKSWFILKTVIFSGKIENNQCIIFVNYLCIY